MENSVKKKRYWGKLLPAVVWHVLYLVFCNSFGRYTRVYFDLVFYLGIAVYFFLWGDWRFSEWNKAMKRGRRFWLPTLFTALGMAAAFGVGVAATALFRNADDGTAVFGVNNWGSLTAFALVTIFLPPIAEEVFYRKAVTAFDSKAVLLISVLVSISLYASEHSLMPLGFLQACLWAVPFNVAYLKTKNIYVCMTAHFLCNLVVNGAAVIGSALALARFV